MEIIVKELLADYIPQHIKKDNTAWPKEVYQQDAKLVLYLEFNKCNPPYKQIKEEEPHGQWQ